MKGTEMEMTYACAKYACEATTEVEKVVNTLRQLDKPVTCCELGLLVYGEKYRRKPAEHNYRKDGYYYLNQEARTLTGRLNQVLQHLVREGFVKVGAGEVETYTYTYCTWIEVDDKDEPEYITVWDKSGTEYQMKNPKFNFRTGRRKPVDIEKEGHRRPRTYEWVRK